jgi:hypothetical protein
MKGKLDPIIILDGMINDLKNRTQYQDEIGDRIVLNKLVDKITQVKKQSLFERTEHEYTTAVSRLGNSLHSRDNPKIITEVMIYHKPLRS